MHDIRLMRDDPAAFDASLARRGFPPVASELVALDERRRALMTEAQVAQARRNEASKAIGAAKAAKDEATAATLMAEVATLKERLPAIEAEEKALGESLNAQLAAIPNLPLGDVPEGADEAGNMLVASHGTPGTFGFTPREHDAIGPALGLDFETGAAMAGARFTLVRGAAARLHRALGQFMLDTLSGEHGYEQVVPPLLVRDEAVFGTGQLEQVLQACADYPGANNARRITFEYVMLKDKNDSDADARELVRLLKKYDLPAKVNLIPFNPWPGAPYECSTPERIKAFSNIVFDSGISAPVRTPRGRDIDAACGQLKTASEKRTRAELDRLAEEKQAALG